MLKKLVCSDKNTSPILSSTSSDTLLLTIMASGETSLVSKCFRGRLRSDPSIGVSDLMKPFELLFESEATRDIKGLLEIGKEYDFKSSPQPSWLCKLHILFGNLIDVAPNTVITSRKLRDALQKLHDDSSLMPPNNKKDPDTILDWVDQKVRVGMAQLRELKDNTHACKDRAYKKCSDTEKAKLTTMLAKISLVRGQDFEKSPTEEKHSDDDEGQQKTGTTDKDSTKNALHKENKSMLESMAMVEVHGKTPTKTTRRASTPSSIYHHGQEDSSTRKKSPSSSGTPGAINPAHVFQSILGKNKKKRKKSPTTTSGGYSSEEGEETPEKISKRAAKKRLTFSDSDEEGVTSVLPGFVILPAGKEIMKDKKKKDNDDGDDDEHGAPKTPKKKRKTEEKPKKTNPKTPTSCSGRKKKKGDISFIDSVLNDGSKVIEASSSSRRHGFSEDTCSLLYPSFFIRMLFLLLCVGKQTF